MKVLPIIYLMYMFISLYFLSLFFLIYIRNRKNIFDYPAPNKNYSVSFLVPAFNEENTIAETLRHIFDIDYSNISNIEEH